MTIGTQTQKVPALRIGRAGRLPWRFAAAVMGLLVMAEAAWLTVTVIVPDPVWDLGMDYRYYASLGARWLADGTFYLPHQLSGVHQAGLLGLDQRVDTLYPPTALLLFVPFAWLPAVLWWTIPLAVLGAALYRLRPQPVAWFVMALLLMWPRAIGAFLFGNTDMWIVAGVAAGLVWGWPAGLVLIKPTLAPLALVGVRSRWFWTLSVLAVVVTLPLWRDYVTAMLNQRGLDIGYSLGALPLVCAPLVPVLLRYRIPKRDGERRRSDDDLEGAHLAP